MDAKPSRYGLNISAIESKWDCIYGQADSSVPIEVLLNNTFLLPAEGVALDLACGLGANALLLAEHGLDTHAWDVSSVALAKLTQNAQNKSLKLTIKQLFIEADKLPKNSFDVIVLGHFLDRSLCDAIMDSLKPDGLLFYQTYVREKVGSKGPNNPVFLLARNELLELFSPLKVLVYRENSRVGNLACGERNEALFIGQK